MLTEDLSSYWSTATTAEFLGVTPTTLGNWIRKGTAPASYKLSPHRRLFNPKDVQTWLENRFEEQAS